ncbi:MAG: TonB-dependent receptor [Parvularculaceae bacterium]|nr:TonB-dependent receptor [Parvularculaceae bacterium]
MLRALMLSGAAWLALSGASAGAVEPDATASSGLSVAAASGPLPVREAIRSLAQDAGMVVIFDGRRLGDQQVSIDPDAPPREALEEVLVGFDLELQPIAGSTFAVAPRLRVPGNTRLAALDTSAVSGAAGATFVDTIVVTGAVLATAPIGHEESLITLDGDMLQLLSEARVAEAIFDLPQALASFSSANTALFGLTAGINLADLRGLGHERTQVFVNGRRRTPHSGGNGSIWGVDLTLMPRTFVKQIEVLDVSQTTALGSDAFIGSINIVLDQHEEGLRFQGRSSISERGDAEQHLFGLNYGRSWAGGKGSIFGALEVAAEEPLFGRDRWFTANPYGYDSFDVATRAFLPGFGGSTITPAGAYTTVLTPEGRRISLGRNTSAVGPGGEPVPLTGSIDQRFNWAEHQTRILPNDRVIGYVASQYDITPQTELFAEFNFASGETNVQLSPLPVTGSRGANEFFGDGVVIGVDDDRLPQSMRDVVSQLGGDRVIISQRFAGLGPRRTALDRDVLDLVLGVDHQFSERNSLNAYLRYGETNVTSLSRGLTSEERLATALDSDACAATPGCSVVNPFEIESYAAAADYLSVESQQPKITVSEWEAYADFASEVPFTEAGPLALLVGISTRHSEISTRTEEQLETIVGDPGRPFYQGSLDQSDVFARGVAPVTASGHVLGEISVGAGARVGVQSRVGVLTQGELFVDWRPLDGVLLRTLGSYGERPANLAESFVGANSSRQAAFDLCEVPTFIDNPNIVENCASDGPLGVPDNFSPRGLLIERSFAGDPTRDPEELVTFRADLILEPEKIWNFSQVSSRFRLSYTDLAITNGLTIVADPMLDCYGSVGLSDRSCGTNPVTGQPLIQRDPETGELQSISALFVGGASAHWRGLDAEARLSYRPLDWGSVDRLWLSALHTHILEADLGDVDRAGSVDYPQNRTLLAAGIDSPRQQWALQANRRGRVEVSTRLDQRLDPFTTIDLAWRIHVSDRLRFTLSAANITDRTPSPQPFDEGRNVLAQHYDIIGRRYALQLDWQF